MNPKILVINMRNFVRDTGDLRTEFNNVQLLKYTNVTTWVQLVCRLISKEKNKKDNYLNDVLLVTFNVHQMTTTAISQINCSRSEKSFDFNLKESYNLNQLQLSHTFNVTVFLLLFLNIEENNVLKLRRSLPG